MRPWHVLFLLAEKAFAREIRVGFLLDWALPTPSVDSAVFGAALQAVDALNMDPDMPHTFDWVWHASDDTIERGVAATEVLLDSYNVDVLIGLGSQRVAPYAAVLAAERNVPAISWGSGPVSSPSYPPIFYLGGSYASMLQTFVLLCLENRWHKVGLMHSTDSPYAELGNQLRSELEDAGIAVGPVSGLSREEACTTPAGKSASSRDALDRAELAGVTIQLVLGTCADYRQVMKGAADKGLLKGWGWVMLEGATNFYCHRSEMVCGVNDGRDAEVLDAMVGTLSIGWNAPSPLDASLGADWQVDLPPSGSLSLPPGVEVNPWGDSYTQAGPQAPSVPSAVLAYDAVSLFGRIAAAGNLGGGSAASLADPSSGSWNGTSSTGAGRERQKGQVKSIAYAEGVLPFHGKSGWVELGLGGYRLMSNSTIQSVTASDDGNFLQCRDVWLYNGSGSLQKSDLAGFLWPGGATEMPGNQGRGSGSPLGCGSIIAAVLAITLFLLVAVLLLILCTTYAKKRRRPCASLMRLKSKVLATEDNCSEQGADELVTSLCAMAPGSRANSVRRGEKKTEAEPPAQLAQSVPEETSSGHANGLQADQAKQGRKSSPPQLTTQVQRGTTGRHPAGQTTGSSNAARRSPSHTPPRDARAISGASYLDTSPQTARSKLHGQRKLWMQEEMAAIPSNVWAALQEVECDAGEIEIGELLGAGSFGEVRYGRYSEEDVAVKILFGENRSALLRFRTEVLMMKDLAHENIVALRGASWRTGRLIIVEELVGGGNLACLLQESDSNAAPLTWEDHKLAMACDIARGMAYLHGAVFIDAIKGETQRGIIHRDLKPHNCLLGADMTIKIGDLGESRGVAKSNETMSQVGTLIYVAPEIMRGEKYDEKCDLYSFAIVLLAMLQLGETPSALFTKEFLRVQRGKVGEDEELQACSPMLVSNAIATKHLRPALPDGVQPTLASLIEQCWQPSPATRPTFAEALEYLDQIARDEIVLCKEPTPATRRESIHLSEENEMAPEFMDMQREQRSHSFVPIKGEIGRTFLRKVEEGRQHPHDSGDCSE